MVILERLILIEPKHPELGRLFGALVIRQVRAEHVVKTLVLEWASANATQLELRPAPGTVQPSPPVDLRVWQRVHRVADSCSRRVKIVLNVVIISVTSTRQQR